MSRITTRVTTSVTVPGTDQELELVHATDQDESDMFFHVGPSSVIVGYLVHDQHCEDPMKSSDGNGEIFTRRFGAGTEQHKGFQNALGLDGDFRPAFSCISDEDVTKLIHEDIKLSAAKIFDNGGLFEKCFKHVAANYEVTPNETLLDFTLNSLNDINELTPVVSVDAYYIVLWTRGRLDGTIGSKYALMLDVFEHGNVLYSLCGEGVNDRWDTAKGGAVWVPDANACENFEDKALSYEENFKKAREYARGIVEEFTCWSNGECYGLVIEKHDLETGDVEGLQSVWGFIGADYAKGECKEQFDYEVENASNVPVPQPAAPDAGDNVSGADGVVSAAGSTGDNTAS